MARNEKGLSANSNVFIPPRPDVESLPILNVLDDGFALRADNGFHPMFRRAYGSALRFSDRSSVSFTRVDGGIIICGPSGIDTVYKLVTVQQGIRSTLGHLLQPLEFRT